jgi:hypothetical protein
MSDLQQNTRAVVAESQFIAWEIFMMRYVKKSTTALATYDASA